MKRSAGILCPIFSLPSKYGIGTLGRSAYDFIDFLKKTNQSVWQILPIGCTSYGDSPYQSFSAYAGNPYFIDLDILCEQGYLSADEYQDINWGFDERKIDYGCLYGHRFDVLRKASDRLFEKNKERFEQFCRFESSWLDDFALFMALKTERNGDSFLNWDKEYRVYSDLDLEYVMDAFQEEIRFWKSTQYFFFDQYHALKRYANENGISIIGDIPIYVALDSVEVWSHPENFQVDENGCPIEVAGCPPDGFSEDGQLWGNPLFDWQYMKENRYDWWIDRIRHQLRFVDILRIDHFRGFESYYAIPFGETTAKNGIWKKGPGIDLFHAIHDRLGDISIIAEDLGYLTQEVVDLVHETGYPGMKVLQFAFDTRDTGSGYCPHCYINNSVAYTGTHDNDTVLGWVNGCCEDDFKLAKEYMRLTQAEGYNWGMIKTCLGSVSDLAIIPLADYLDQGSEGRINIPSTSSNNWVWRFKDEDLTSSRMEKIAYYTCLYGR